MKNLEIGIVTITYDENGVVLDAGFLPTLQVGLSQELASQLKKVTTSEDATTVKTNADLVFAGWFSKMNEIELSDRYENPISSEVITCEKWSNGKVKLCVLRYVFQGKD